MAMVKLKKLFFMYPSFLLLFLALLGISVSQRVWVFGKVGCLLRCLVQDRHIPSYSASASPSHRRNHQTVMIKLEKLCFVSLWSLPLLLA